MTTFAQPNKELYQHLGILFYAMAKADKKVHQAEITELRAIVKTQWLPLDDLTDEFGTDAAYQIEIVFDWLLEEDKESDTLFEEFEAYYKAYQNQFSPEIKTLTWKTAQRIAASFSGKNKSELMLLAKLELLMG
ncbi:hypothetical protein U1E44_03685 [Arenibacter sp. GZD96]|uniref:hypothetical protein n=1 Tax=Aurantibrevibacter litoralis TaxID=3106030 RepID=UPI002AFDFD23|nr:hypothetical protein [Arenibacter sp. GZD-96]MEA1785180.1 hypothetical protein [Arenibacter sp. GZD-96]